MFEFLKRLFSGKRRRLGSSQTSSSALPDFLTISDPHVHDVGQTNSSSHGGHHPSSSHSFDSSSDGGGHAG
jgi:hypothetical protein